ncbi:fatty acid desaturase [Nostoc sp. CCY 9925]|uniref:fatty acid desaturase n=1 Tax=Nostoc sp. CCY 9925 TaxID=3103865 RepID=UPI0039C64C5F
MQKYKFAKSIQTDIEALSKLDNWHCIAALLEDYFFIFTSIIVTHNITFYFYPLAVFIIGARQRALATLLHEAAHGILAKNRHLNFVIGTFFSGYLIFQNFTSYKNSHLLLHHGHFGNPMLDPDYLSHINQGLYDKIPPKTFFIKNIIMPFFLIKTPSYLKFLMQYRILDRNRITLEGYLMFVYLLIIVIVLCSINLNFWKIIGLFWLIPYLTSFQIIGWFIELSEHYPLMQCSDIDLYMTRNRKNNVLEFFLSCIHNEQYHLDHHLNTKTPFWNLPKAHKIRLQDDNYVKVNESTGGIFIPSKKSPSILQYLCQEQSVKGEG